MGFFYDEYLSSLSLNYVAMNKDLENHQWPPQLYQITIKICFEQGYHDIRVVIATR